MDVDNQSGANRAPGNGSELNPPEAIIVIGAGAAGLAAARRLQRAGLPVVVLERANRSGGRIFTDKQAGYHIDVGAEFIAHFYDRTLAMAHETGIDRDIHHIPASSAILRGGRGYRVWAGPQASLSPLLAMTQKLRLARAAADLLRHGRLLDLAAFNRAVGLDTRTAAEYARERLSSELLEYIIQPTLAGIFYWTPERTSQAMLLILLKAAASRPAGMQLSTFRHGMGEIIGALASGLHIVHQATVERAEPDGDSGYRVLVNIAGERRALRASGIICATTASMVPQIFPTMSASRRAFFNAIHYSTNISLMVGMRKQLPEGTYSLLFPRRESSLLASATIQGVKNPAQVPPGHDMIALHMNGPASAEHQHTDDEALQVRILEELQRLAPTYHPGKAIDFQQLYRWPEALPEFDVGHFDRLQRFATGEIEWGSIVFAGDYLGGPFVEGAISSGEQAADRLIIRLRKARPA
jgi:protoporphyrinogen/coproporphyrinogen III oxidase